MQKEQDFRMFGVIGNPIEHSMSPTIHNNWINQYKLRAFYTYLCVKNQYDLKDVLITLPKMGFGGINITIPYKEEVFNIVKDYAVLSPEVKNIGVINTIKYDDGNVFAYNTDIEGFGKSLSNQDFKDKLAVVFGAGGAAKAVVYSLLNRGAKVIIAARDIKKGMVFADLLLPYGDISVRKWENIDIYLPQAAIIVNTTPLGLKNENIEIGYNLISQECVCYDLIYLKNYSITPFLQQCQQRGLFIMDGYKMLELQAASAFEKWFGIYPDVK